VHFSRNSRSAMGGLCTTCLNFTGKASPIRAENLIFPNNYGLIILEPPLRQDPSDSTKIRRFPAHINHMMLYTKCHFLNQKEDPEIPVPPPEGRLTRRRTPCHEQGLSNQPGICSCLRIIAGAPGYHLLPIPHPAISGSVRGGFFREIVHTSPGRVTWNYRSSTGSQMFI